MIVLGIDPGYAKLGCSVVKKFKDSYEIIESLLIETKPGDAHEKRILFIGNAVQKIIFKHQPQALSIEKIFFSTNQKTAIKVSEIKGAVMFLAATNNIPCFEFTPLEIKMALCGYGKADKKQIQEMVKIILNLKTPPKQDDVADSIAVALTCFLTKKIY